MAILLFMLSCDLTSLQKPKPFLKWVGGKTQLINEIEPLIKDHTSRHQNFTYIEPFVGGGAVLFHLLSKFSQIENVIINDINSSLVTAYQLIKEDYHPLIFQLSALEETYYKLDSIESKKKFYLAKRDEFNQEDGEFSLVKKIALMIFLNKTCFNGLYRVNSQGKFNVPFGKYKQPKICNKNNIISIHHHLQKVKITQGDFEQTLKYAHPPTLFYLDPPYKPIKSTSAFTSYSVENFNDEDQLRVKQFCDQISMNGHYFILSNSDLKNFDDDNTFFDDLYQEYKIKRVKAKRSINSQGDGRGELFELLISNF